MNKDVIIINTVSGERREITLEPGATAGDILQTLGLRDYILSLDGTPGSRLSGRDNVYEKVENGAKLWATTEAKVGRPSIVA